jgi:hypothetical protein
MNEKETQGQLKGFPVTFNIYARSEKEVEDLRMAIIAFIGAHARQGRAVDAARLARAIGRWEENPIVRSRIIGYFK